MKRAIQELRDLVTGEELVADKFLPKLDEPALFELRRKLKADYKQNSCSLVCSICNSPVYLAGQEHYFKHWKELGDCPIKTRGRFSQKEINRMKYNGVKESLPHIQIKDHLYSYLSQCSICIDVKKEEVVKSLQIKGWWKKPDLSLKCNGNEIAIEIQLSTTFLDVIVERDLFYKENGIYILWVFDDKEQDRFRFTEKMFFMTTKGMHF